MGGATGYGRVGNFSAAMRSKFGRYDIISYPSPENSQRGASAFSDGKHDQ